jgi:hypothetical protein
MPTYSKGKVKITTWIGLATAILLFYAPFYEGDYDYYMLLRFIVTFVSWFWFLGSASDWPEGAFFTIAYIIAVLLFQPFAMLSFSRKTWAFIDFFYGTIYLITFIKGASKDLSK